MDKVTKEMLTRIRWICSHIGPRPPCSEAERRLAEYIRDHWKELTETRLETFTCHPDAYQATLRWPVALFIFSLCLYHLVPFLSLLCSAASVLIIVFNLILNRELIDPLFPERISCNVSAVFPPRGKAERTVVVSCHHDSHFAFPLLNRFGAKYSLFMAMIVFSNVLVLFISMLGVLFQLAGSPAMEQGFHRISFPILLVLTMSVPAHLYTFLKVISDRPVPGANDNLSGVAVCMALADHLAIPEHRPERTEVWLVSFGCEEIGIRGSKRFLANHGNRLRNAYVLNLDMVGGRGTKLRVVTKEEKTLISLSENMVQIMQDIARRLDIPLEAGPIIAFTDAMAFAMHGIHATTLMALDETGIVNTYHSLDDTPENLDSAILLDSYRLCRAFLERIDDMPSGKQLNQ